MPSPQRRVLLLPGKERALRMRHPWIFSGAVAELPPCAPGELLSVYSAEGDFLAQATFHPGHSLIGRVLAWEEGPIEELLRRRIAEALSWRVPLAGPDEACRLINGEGDGLPGWIVDRYGAACVFQIASWGMERLRPLLLDTLRAELPLLRSLYEKSVGSARQQEGLPPREGTVWGEPLSATTCWEHGIHWHVSFAEGQKTGLFLDQREMRLLARRFAAGRRVLNCCAYTGGFSLNALQGGAEQVTSVDISAKALRFLDENLQLNPDLDRARHTSVTADVFDYLSQAVDLPFDLIILDPPAFVKKRADLAQASRGYQALHQLLFAKMRPGCLLLTSSCSSYLQQEPFERLIAQAALKSKREVQILSRHLAAADHPTSLYHPEGNYLKSLFIRCH